MNKQRLTYMAIFKTHEFFFFSLQNHTWIAQITHAEYILKEVFSIYLLSNWLNE